MNELIRLRDSRDDRIALVDATEHLGLTNESVEVVSTKGKKRNARFHYAADYPATIASQGVLLEMGIRGGTLPGLLSIQVKSFIAEYLYETNQAGNFLEENAVETLVLDPVRRSYEESSTLFYGESPSFEECLTIVHANSDLLFCSSI